MRRKKKLHPYNTFLLLHEMAILKFCLRPIIITLHINGLIELVDDNYY